MTRKKRTYPGGGDAQANVTVNLYDPAVKAELVDNLDILGWTLSMFGRTVLPSLARLAVKHPDRFAELFPESVMIGVRPVAGDGRRKHGSPVG